MKREQTLLLMAVVGGQSLQKLLNNKLVQQLSEIIKRKVCEEEEKKYIGVYPSGDNWIARVSNRTNDDRKKKRVYLRTFPTVKRAAIAFDTTVLHFRTEEPLHRLNFSQYASAIQGILKARSD